MRHLSATTYESYDIAYTREEGTVTAPAADASVSRDGSVVLQIYPMPFPHASGVRYGELVLRPRDEKTGKNVVVFPLEPVDHDLAGRPLVAGVRGQAVIPCATARLSAGRVP